jgi:hypothetical protein
LWYDPDMPHPNQPPYTAEWIEDVFAYHAPDETAKLNHEAIRMAARHFAAVIVSHTPACADQSAAIRLVREAMMTANAAIALKGRV